MNEPMKRTITLAALLLGILLLAPTLQAAPEPAKTTQLDGDVITYVSKTGVMTAQGGVKLTQGNAVMTGDSGEYTCDALIIATGGRPPQTPRCPQSGKWACIPSREGACLMSAGRCRADRRKECTWLLMTS